MAQNDSAQQKTEAPTPRRKEEAKRRGQVAKSRDFSAAVVLMSALLLFYLMQKTAVQSWKKQLIWYFSNCFNFNYSAEHLINGFFNFIQTIFVMLIPFILVLIGSTLIVQLAQTGFVFSTQTLSPSLDRLNPIHGLQRIFSLRGLVELIKSIIKVVLVAVVSYLVVKAHLPALLLVFNLSPDTAFAVIANIILNVVAFAGGAFLLLSLGDLIYQRWDFIRGLRMTKEEIKEELKQTEGDPHVKSWRRRRQQQIAANLIRAEVPRATVVITNPVHLAVALRYVEKETEAPRLLVKGAGDMAQSIKKIALAHNVPVVANPEVARALYYQVEIFRQIPVELYQAVAQILALVYRKRGVEI